MFPNLRANNYLILYIYHCNFKQLNVSIWSGQFCRIKIAKWRGIKLESAHYTYFCRCIFTGLKYLFKFCYWLIHMIRFLIKMSLSALHCILILFDNFPDIKLISEYPVIKTANPFDIDINLKFEQQRAFSITATRSTLFLSNDLRIIQSRCSLDRFNR